MRSLEFVAIALFLCLGCAQAWINPWQLVFTANQNPVQDYGGHGTAVVGDYIYEFGGLKENRSKPPSDAIVTIYGTLRKFNTVTKAWSIVIPATSTQPPERCWFGMTSVGTDLYLFGGTSYNYAPLGDFWKFDTLTGVWTNLTQTGGPQRRSGPVLISYNGNLLLFGGLDTYTTVGYSELWEYNTSGNSWSVLATTGTAPPGRALVRGTVYGNQLYVYGGEGFNPEINYFSYANDLYRVNLATRVWQKVQPVSTLERTRLHYAVAAVGNAWHFHAGDYGNCSDLDLLVPSTAVYDFLTNKWSDAYIPGYASGPISKRAELTCVSGDICYHTGGYTGVKCKNSEVVYLNQVWSFRPSNIFLQLSRALNQDG